MEKIKEFFKKNFFIDTSNSYDFSLTDDISNNRRQ